jgi:glucose-1-phosphate thymidylyltransferase
VLTLGDNNVVLEMAEKPQNPKTNWCCPPFYYYKKEDANKISKAIESGCNTDAPGSFISWLCKNSTVYAMEMPGKRYDIGNIDSYNKVQTEYKGITR